MYSDVHEWWSKQTLVTFFVKWCVLAAARVVGRGRFRGKGGHILLPPHPPTALPRQCYQHTLVYKNVSRFCLAHHLWTSLCTYRCRIYTAWHVQSDAMQSTYAPRCLSRQVIGVRRVPWLSHSDLLETPGGWGWRYCEVSHVKICCWSLFLLC